MKNILFIAALLCTQTMLAQYEYKFTTVRENPATSVKNQAATGTCWCFATTSFIESELLRMGKGEYDLSEMFIVRYNYKEKMADNYLRGGRGNIDQGSVSHNYLKMVKKYGIVPQEAYPGINYDSPTHDHTMLSKYVKGISAIAVANKEPVPQELVDGLMDAYLGRVPDSFTYKGKEYTPKSFFESLGLDLSDYVEVGSFSHHPFYEKITLEVPDNWDHELIYNVPLNEMISIMDNAIEKGYTVGWDGDISEPGYDFTHLKIALNTDIDLKSLHGDLKERIQELPVTQESRQKGYENKTTTDDHLEHITGIARDQEGVKYYITKNSWGYDRNGTGYHYMSENYVKAKTIFILVHKDSIPKEIRSKLGIE